MKITNLKVKKCAFRTIRNYIFSAFFLMVFLGLASAQEKRPAQNCPEFAHLFERIVEQKETEIERIRQGLALFQNDPERTRQLSLLLIRTGFETEILRQARDFYKANFSQGRDWRPFALNPELLTTDFLIGPKNIFHHQTLVKAGLIKLAIAEVRDFKKSTESFESSDVADYAVKNAATDALAPLQKKVFQMIGRMRTILPFESDLVVSSVGKEVAGLGLREFIGQSVVRGARGLGMGLLMVAASQYVYGQKMPEGKWCELIEKEPGWMMNPLGATILPPDMRFPTFCRTYQSDIYDCCASRAESKMIESLEGEFQFTLKLYDPNALLTQLMVANAPHCDQVVASQNRAGYPDPDPPPPSLAKDVWANRKKPIEGPRSDCR